MRNCVQHHTMARSPRSGRRADTSAGASHPVRSFKFDGTGRGAPFRGQCLVRAGQFDDPADRRDLAHVPAAQLGAAPGCQERPQAGAVHERDAGHVEHEPRAALADDRRQGQLQRGLRAGVVLSADRHDGAAVTGADTQGQTHDPTLTALAAGPQPQRGRFSANWTGDAGPPPPWRRWSDEAAGGQEVQPGAGGLEAAPRAA
jgi:hypothetical protein